MDKTKIMEWENAKKALDVWKATEMRLRLEIHKEAFNARETPGTESLELGNGYKLKLTAKQTVKVDSREAAETILSILPDHYHDLIRWKAEVSQSVFNKLPAELRSEVENHITISPATPTLEIVAPKGAM